MGSTTLTQSPLEVMQLRRLANCRDEFAPPYETPFQSLVPMLRVGTTVWDAPRPLDGQSLGPGR